MRSRLSTLFPTLVAGCKKETPPKRAYDDPIRWALQDRRLRRLRLSSRRVTLLEHRSTRFELAARFRSSPVAVRRGGFSRAATERSPDARRMQRYTLFARRRPWGCWTTASAAAPGGAVVWVLTRRHLVGRGIEKKEEYSSRLRALTATSLFVLAWWTERISERTKDATIARFRAQKRAAADALKKVQASVNRHRFDRYLPTMGTGDSAFLVHLRKGFSFRRP
jgi:hypothetical protein